jgi:hypothetical protein
MWGRFQTRPYFLLLGLRVFSACANFAEFQILESTSNAMSPRSVRRTRRIRKLLHFSFLLRALRDLRGEMSVFAFGCDVAVL